MIGTAEMPSAPAASGPASAGVVLPVRVWRDYLSLGVTEIREYGGDSVQVVRRLRALLEQLADLVLPENRPAVEDELRRLEATAAAAFGDRIDKDLAARRRLPGHRRPRQASRRDGGPVSPRNLGDRGVR